MKGKGKENKGKNGRKEKTEESSLIFLSEWILLLPAAESKTTMAMMEKKYHLICKPHE